jgi:hypothetical protein
MDKGKYSQRTRKRVIIAWVVWFLFFTIAGVSSYPEFLVTKTQIKLQM